MKWRFKVEDKKIICVSWKDDENQTEIHSERKQKKIMHQVYKIPALENNKVYHAVQQQLCQKKEVLLVDWKCNRNEYCLNLKAK